MHTHTLVAKAGRRPRALLLATMFIAPASAGAEAPTRAAKAESAAPAAAAQIPPAAAQPAATAALPSASTQPGAGHDAGASLDPVGDWYTINEESKKATSIVHIGWENGALVGRVRKVLTTNRGPNPLCERCDGERHDKPIVGMDVLWGLHGRDGSYEGGHVLDPSKGKQYRAKLKMRSPDVLELRGFIGFAAFGRTQVWQRVPAGTDVPEVK